MFFEKLKELREEKNYSQKFLASLLGLSANIICEYEKGRSQPNIETLTKLADIFNCSIDYIVGREDDFGIIKSSSTVPELRPEEKQLLLDFNKLSDTNKYKVIGYCHALINY